MSQDLTLSKAELAILKDKALMPLKHSVMTKIDQLLNLERLAIAKEIKENLHVIPKDMDYKTGKLSKGENYKTYPYRVLDYPKAFHSKDIFTFRTLVLWGHHCSFHLILAGKYKKRFEGRIIQRSADFPDSLFLSCQKSPWEWEFNDKDYLQARAMQEAIIAKAVKRSDFLKVSYFLPLERYEELPRIGRELWRLWMLALFAK